MKCVRNNILKSFTVEILRYAKRMREMYDLANYLTPPPMKEEISMEANWSVCNEEFNTSDLQLVIKDGLPKSIRDKLDDHPEYYCSLTYEDWCDLLSTIDIKYERKIAAVHIEKIASSREASQYNSNNSVGIPRRKKSKTGVLSSNKSPIRAHDRHHVIRRYCVLCKKAVIPERKYESHSVEDCTDVCTKRSVKY